MQVNCCVKKTAVWMGEVEEGLPEAVRVVGGMGEMADLREGCCARGERNRRDVTTNGLLCGETVVRLGEKGCRRDGGRRRGYGVRDTGELTEMDCCGVVEEMVGYK